MGKNILILTGSPRKNGNSEMMAEAFAKGAKAKGHEATIFRAATKKIEGCKACDTCWSKGTACSFRDDFAELEPLLEKADALVFVSPIYWFSFSAQIKAAIDRIYAYGSDKALRPLKIKESALLCCAADDDLEAFNGTVESFKSSCKFLGWHNAGILTVPSVMDKGDIVKTKALEEAENLGTSF